MTQRGPFLFIVGLLLLAGIATALFRHSEYRVPYLPGAAQSVWQIDARIEFEATGGNSQVVLTLPPEQSDFRLKGGNGASAGYGFIEEQGKTQRKARWAKRDTKGDQLLFYKLEAIADEGFLVPPIPPAGTTEVVWEEPYRTATRTVLNAVLPQTADGYTLARQLLLRMNTDPLDQNMSLLLQEWPAARLLPRMLNTAGVDARFVSALDLEDQRRRQQLRELVQVWDGESWRLIDPESPNRSNTENLLMWQTGAPSVLEVIGGTDSKVTFSMIRQSQSALSLVDEGNNSPLVSLYSLPVEEQSMFKLIMLLPVGAFVVVLMRILVGFRTSGTFMPVLIALSFLQTELLPGLISFLLVVAVGLVIRSYLSALNLLLVARIATLVIVVIGIISVFSILSYQLGLIGGLTITFFPMIILAWTIERMSILWEEEGPKEVLIQGGGSLFVAVLAYLLMTQPVIQHLAFNFPELHLCLLAVILLVGRYTGYRLTELTRFTGMPH